jgi:hypothetical protein
MTYAIKVKHEEDKRWSFLTSSGGTTYLRMHASQFQDDGKASKLVAEIIEDNPDFAAKVVPFRA